MGQFDDAKELIGHCKPTFNKIEHAYKESLHDTEIKKTLLIEIKNFMENLRSALDFTAHGLFDKYGKSGFPKPRIYFPYAWTSLDKVHFQSHNIIEKNLPGVAANRPAIATIIESYQHFESADNSWLPKFMELNNENKHQQLTPQIRKETKQLNISSEGVLISLGQGTSISVRHGTSISFGGLDIPGGQCYDANNPAKIIGNGKQEVITWVSFLFSTNNELVLPLLKQSLDGTEKIVNELSNI
jgi:hypothetical protein